MEIAPIITHFTDTDLYKLTMCCAILNCFPRAQAQYTFVDRNNTVYPKGFADELNKQIAYLENVKITEEEIEFMKSRCYFIPNWFYTFLRGFKYNREWVEAYQDEDGHLHVHFGRKSGYWHETVLLEVQVMAIIARLYYIMTNQDDKYDSREYYKKAYKKAEYLLRMGLTVSDFGTRRRFSFDAEEQVVKAFVDCQFDLGKCGLLRGKFVGTSNVYLAMKYNVTPVGTMAHEFVSAIAGMYGPVEANYIAMEMWQKTFNGSLGIYLYDTYGFDAFADNFSEHYARVFAGLRVDSGENLEQLDKIIAKYTELGIDPKSKQVVFSNALDTESAVELHLKVNGRVLDSYGIGTHFTNDLEGVKPMNMVIKLLSIRMTEKRKWQKTCKMSEDKGKTTGDSDIVETFNFLLNKE